VDFGEVAGHVAVGERTPAVFGETVWSLPEQPARATAIIGMAAKVLTLNDSVHLRPGRRAKCVLDTHGFEANVPVRVPFWMFGGRGFPYGGERWPDWSQVAACWLHPDDTLLPAWD